MKLKYKKMVILVTMSTMFIGLVIFGIVTPSKSSNETKETKKKVEATQKPEGKTQEEATSTPTKESETLLQKDANEKVNQLISNYFKLGLKCDVEGLKEIHTDPKLILENELKAKYKYVENVKNIECYTMDGPEENSYLIYVYSEFKFKDIKTLAPGLSRLYVKETKDGTLKIFNGSDADINDYILKADKEEEVQALVDKVSTKLEEALSSDADLKKFNEEVLNKKADSEPKESDTKSKKS